jgi:carboxymethylenebutenolidase
MPTSDLWIERSRFPRDHTFTRFHLARPRKLAPYAAVLVVPDRTGLTPFVEDLLGRLATATREGCLALAVDQFTRAPKTPEGAEQGEAFLRSVPDREFVSELDQARAYLQRRADVDRRRLAILGIGTGGHYAFEWCARNFDASGLVCVNAPYLSDDAAQVPLRAPYALVEQLRVPMLALFGEKDSAVPVGTPERLGQWLERHRKPFHLKTYPDVGRGLLDPAEAGHDRKAADDAWSMIVKFLGEQLERGTVTQAS